MRLNLNHNAILQLNKVITCNWEKIIYFTSPVHTFALVITKDIWKLEMYCKILFMELCRVKCRNVI